MVTVLAVAVGATRTCFVGQVVQAALLDRLRVWRPLRVVVCAWHQLVAVQRVGGGCAWRFAGGAAPETPPPRHFFPSRVGKINTAPREGVCRQPGLQTPPAEPDVQQRRHML